MICCNYMYMYIAQHPAFTKGKTQLDKIEVEETANIYLRMDQ